MNAPQDGGPAFPNSGEIFIDGPQGRMAQSAWGMEGQKGMSLRDYFAAAALASMAIAPDYSKGPCNAAMAQRAYVIADAMLSARKEQP